MQVGVSAVVSSADDVRFVQDAERVGATSVWVPEAWGYDALTPLAHLAAVTSDIRLATGIVQVGARTPAMLAMQAMSVQQLSGGRLVLGLGSSGPRIMEAWHGVGFRKPVATMRETIKIVRQIARGERLEHHGEIYDLPPEGAGRGIRSLAPAVDPIPMVIAALGPKNLELTGELADGWLGNAFMPEHAEVFLAPIRIGAERAGRSLADLDLVMPVAVEFTDDPEEAGRRHADGYAFTIGAMGAPGKNFYNRAFGAQGYADDVAAVYELWQAGRREEAAARVPFDIGFKTNLLGPPDVIRDRVRRYRDAGITTLQAKVSGPDRLDTIAQLVDIVREVDGTAEAPNRPEHRLRSATVPVMGDSEQKLPFDAAFDDAFDHLSECRRAYEDDPRDPQKFAALGAARAALEDARKVMEAERTRLGLEPRKVQLPDGPHVDSDGRAEWQGILGD